MRINTGKIPNAPTSTRAKAAATITSLIMELHLNGSEAQQHY